MQLRPIGPVAVPAGGAPGVNVLPVAADAQRGSITRVRLFANNTTGAPADVTVTVTGLAAIVTTVPAYGSVCVLDDVPVQQTDPANNTQVNVATPEVGFVAFGSFVVT